MELRRSHQASRKVFRKPIEPVHIRSPLLNRNKSKVEGRRVLYAGKYGAIYLHIPTDETPSLQLSQSETWTSGVPCEQLHTSTEMKEFSRLNLWPRLRWHHIQLRDSELKSNFMI